jgi:hypothetical protein
VAEVDEAAAEAVELGHDQGLGEPAVEDGEAALEPGRLRIDLPDAVSVTTSRSSHPLRSALSRIVLRGQTAVLALRPRSMP